MLVNGLLVKEKNGSSVRLTEEVTGESSDPSEDLESGVGLEHEERNSLLHE
jgi:hypothetical protein